MSNNQIEFKEIENYYGTLTLKKESGKYYWAIQDWDGYTWQEIPTYLYEALSEFYLEQVIKEFNTKLHSLQKDLDNAFQSLNDTSDRVLNETEMQQEYELINQPTKQGELK
jgi:hypothetical protein